MKQLLRSFLSLFKPMVNHVIDILLSMQSKIAVQEFISINEYRKGLLLTCEDKTVVDIGTGIGEYLEQIVSYDLNISMIAVEVDDLAYDQLKYKFNNNKDVKLYNIGMWCDNTNNSLYRYVVPSINSFHKLDDKYLNKVKLFEVKSIKCEKLDKFIDGHSITRIGLLHIDCNGSEYEIIKGASYSLSDAIIKNLEISFLTPILYGDSSIDSIVSFLKNYGYDFKMMFSLPVSYEVTKFKLFFELR
jgi:FkbM family methyltransferase